MRKLSEKTSKKSSRFLTKWIYPFFLLILLLGIWESVAYNHLLFPSPSSIFFHLIENKARFWFHTLQTFKEMTFGMLLAISIALPLAWSMHKLPLLKSLFQPFFIILQCIPMFTLAPLMLFWFGWSFIAIVVPTALMMIFPLTMSFYKGIKSTPSQHLEQFILDGATEWQIFYKLRVPFALPHIFSGLKISAAISGVGAIAGEWAGAQSGLGVFLQENRRNLDFEGVFGALVCLSIFTIILFSLIVIVEKRYRHA